jgi:3-deoxy-7-phosphoheptulonate synthase
MLESHLKGGRQDLNGGKEKLEYGVSITDGCIGWETTEQIILKASEKLKAMLNQRKR